MMIPKVCIAIGNEGFNEKDIAEIISEAAGTPDVGVRIVGSHSCMTARGIRNASARTETATFMGAFRDRTELKELVRFD